jgi:hypothetical protein
VALIVASLDDRILHGAAHNSLRNPLRDKLATAFHNLLSALLDVPLPRAPIQCNALHARVLVFAEANILASLARFKAMGTAQQT